MADPIVKKYKNDDITVIWQPHLCIHSTVCFAKLPLVFRPSKRPWVDLSKANTDAIIETVDMCPTDALTWEWNNPDENVSDQEMGNRSEIKARIIKNGPLILPKEVRLFDSNGNEVYAGKPKSICRCGKSKKMPGCDGSHKQINFEDC